MGRRLPNSVLGSPQRPEEGSPGAPGGVIVSRNTFWAAGLVCVVAGGFWLWGHADLPFMFFTGDERHYAEIGRRIASGQGFTTGLIYPIEVDWGVNQEHPSLLRPPLWPLFLAGAFSLGGADEQVAHLLVGVCFVLTCLLAFAIGAHLRGPWVGLIAGVTSAATPILVNFAMIAGTEMLLALWIALVTLLSVRQVNPFWIGVVCGLAYLTRYNAGVLLAASLIFLPASVPRWKPYVLCVLGFGVATAPWLIRNTVITGDPFFSLYTSTLWTQPGVIPDTVLYMLDSPEPSFNNPLVRAYNAVLFSFFLWPVLASNLVAFVGLLLGCIYLSRPHLVVTTAFFVTKIAIALVVIRSRYLVPFIPSMIALGSAAWVMYGGRLGRVALGLVVVMPFLPTIPVPDVFEQVTNAALSTFRERTRSHGDTLEYLFHDNLQFSNCMDEESVVIARDASAVVWAVGNVTIEMPRIEEDFWQLEQSNSVDFVVGPTPVRTRGDEFEALFEHRPECGSYTFQRRVQ